MSFIKQLMEMNAEWQDKVEDLVDLAKEHEDFEVAMTGINMSKNARPMKRLIASLSDDEKLVSAALAWFQNKGREEEIEALGEGRLGKMARRVGKSIKRGVQGWDPIRKPLKHSGDKSEPENMAKRHAEYDTETLKSLQRGPSPIDHTPAAFQQKLIKRNLRKRGERDFEKHMKESVGKISARLEFPNGGVVKAINTLNRLYKEEGIDTRAVKKDDTTVDIYAQGGNFGGADVDITDHVLDQLGGNYMRREDIKESVSFKFTPQELREILRAHKEEDELSYDLMDKVIAWVIDYDPTWMPYGTQKARDGDPYNWVYDHMDEIIATLRKTH